MSTEEKPVKKKKSVLKKILLCFLLLLLAVILVVGGYFIYVFAVYYRIPDNTPLTPEGNNKEVVQLGVEYTAMTYNIGFGAYTPEYSFFMDGGEYSRAFSKESVIEATNGSLSLVKAYDPDILLLQEVDVDSDRSYHVNQTELFRNGMNGTASYSDVFCMNFDSPYLFYPVTDPHGKSVSGLMTFTKFEITSSLRRSFPVADSVMKLVDLDRCYSVTRVPVENGRELVIFTIHMSAYGNSDEVRLGQKQMLKDDMEKEIGLGNYVICGGDFNHDLLAEEDTTEVRGWAYPFPRSFVPEGMHFAVDALSSEELNSVVFSCRDADIPYDPEKSYRILVDGFILSDNITQLDYYTVDNGFRYSDHNPVVLTFTINE